MKDCQEISELIVRSKMERISVRERLAIRFHLMICKHCRQFFRDSDMMDELLTSKRFRDLSEHSFSNSEKAQLKALLESKGDT